MRRLTLGGVRTKTAMAKRRLLGEHHFLAWFCLLYLQYCSKKQAGSTPRKAEEHPTGTPSKTK